MTSRQVLIRQLLSHRALCRAVSPLRGKLLASDRHALWLLKDRRREFCLFRPSSASAETLMLRRAGLAESRTLFLNLKLHCRRPERIHWKYISETIMNHSRPTF